MAVLIAFALVLVFVASGVVRALRSKPLLGAESMIGTLGVARTDIAPEGWVAVRGARWRARTEDALIPAGSKVAIRSMSGLVLIVKAVEVPQRVVLPRPAAISLVDPEGAARPSSDEVELERTA